MSLVFQLAEVKNNTDRVSILSHGGMQWTLALCTNSMLFTLKQNASKSDISGHVVKQRMLAKRSIVGCVG